MRRSVVALALALAAALAGVGASVAGPAVVQAGSSGPSTCC